MEGHNCCCAPKQTTTQCGEGTLWKRIRKPSELLALQGSVAAHGPWRLGNERFAQLPRDKAGEMTALRLAGLAGPMRPACASRCLEPQLHYDRAAALERAGPFPMGCRAPPRTPTCQFEWDLDAWRRVE